MPSVRALLTFALCLAPFLAASARGQDSSSISIGGGCVISENGPAKQTEVTCPNVKADVEKHGITSLREVNATLLTSDEDLILTGEDAALGLTAISAPSRIALSTDEVSLLYGSRNSGNSGGSSGENLGGLSAEQNEVVRQVSRGENDDGERVVTTIYLIGLSEDSLRRIANSETFRVKVGQAVFDFSESPMPAQAEAVLKAR